MAPRGRKEKQMQNKIVLFRNLYEDIHMLWKTWHCKVAADKNDLSILSNWS